MINLNFKSIIELVKAYPTQEVCIEQLEAISWNGNVVSPFDASSKVYKCAGNRYKCRNTNKYFNVCTGTLFDNTKIELQTWFLAIYLITAHKKGISSVQLAKNLSITQKSAWFLNRRIRNCFGMDVEDLDGTIDFDETFLGGKNKNRHADKKVANSQGRSFIDKTPVMGMLQEKETVVSVRMNKRNIDRVVKETIVTKPAFVKCAIVPNTSAATIQPIIKKQ